MTLRLFGRKSGAAKTASTERSSAAQTPAASSPATRPSRRRRGGSGRTSGAAQAPAPQPETEAPTKAAGSRRRGRRGGARRKKTATPSTDGVTAAPDIAPIVLPKGVPATLEEVVARQEMVLEQLMDRQLTALTGLQGSLSAIESRLGGLSGAAGEQRVGIFVDVPNIMYAAERLRVTIDYTKMLQFLIRGRELVRASAYAPISDDLQTPLETQKFVQPFMNRGYSMVTKPLKRYADGSIKANFDVELAIDILIMSDRLDTVILVSGDGDFRRLVELVESKGVRVEVAAFGQSAAAELRAAADEYTDLADHLPELRTK